MEIGSMHKIKTTESLEVKRAGESLEMIQTRSNRLEKVLHDKSKSYMFGDPKERGARIWEK